jgi:hypothetical protein
MARHCCKMMADNVARTCPDHPDRSDCPDCLIEFWPGSSRYGILVHDGGQSMIAIAYCPWCGAKLDEPMAGAPAIPEK